MTMSGERRPMPVAPDAVRVWRGYRNPAVDSAQFFGKLGSIFIPATVQIQAPNGLTAYLPSVLPERTPVAIPDEIALVFYEYQDAYHEAKETVGGRSYSDMHALVFDLSTSTSGFPTRFAGDVTPDERYFLFDEHIDWQFGSVRTFVGASSGDPQAFLGAVRAFLTDVQAQGDDGPDGAIAVASTEHVVYWEHWAEGAERSLIPRLAGAVDPVYDADMTDQPVFDGLWQPYAGLTVSGGESFNTQFTRRHEAD